MPAYKDGHKAVRGVEGIYAIFGPDKRVYVGQSYNVVKRPTVDLARRLGLDWTIVRYMDGTTRSEREAEENLVSDAYERSGYTVVSITPRETLRRAWGAIDVDVRSKRIRDAWSDRRRQEQAERIAKVNANRTSQSRSAANRRRVHTTTQAERSESARKAWVTRRAKRPNAAGDSANNVAQAV